MRYAVKKKWQGNTPRRGMTFIEVLVTLAIFTVLIVTINSLLVSFYRYNAYGIEQAAAIDSARRGIEPTINYIREATYSDEGAYPIESIASNVFVFYSDIDDDKNIEKVRLFLDGNMFKMGVIDSAGDPPSYKDQPETVYILAKNVRNEELGQGVFSYYDSYGNIITSTTDLLRVRFVKMIIVVNVNPQRSPDKFALTASASLRNLETRL